MARGRGFKEFLGIGVETTNGTRVAATSFLRVLSNTPAQDLNPQEDPVLQEELTTRLDYMSELANDDFNLRGNYEGHELLYHALFGTYTFTNNTTYGSHSFAYNPSGTHDFIEGLSLWSTQGLPVGADGPVVRGCVPTQLVMEYAAKDYYRESWSMVGAAMDWATIPTPTFPARLPIMGRHAGNATVIISNVAVGVRSGRVTISTPRDEDTYLYGNQIRPRAERIDRMRISIEFECEMDNTASAGQDLLKDLGNLGAAGDHLITISHNTPSNIPGAVVPYAHSLLGRFDVMGDVGSVQDNGLQRFNLRGTMVLGDTPTDPSITINNSILTQVTT